MRRIYLQGTPRDEALARWLARAALPRREEMLDVAVVLGRVTARPVFAERSMPAYQAAAMDGIAVRAQKTFGASDQRPVVLVLGSDYLPIDTGDPIPEGFDAVIKCEDLQPLTGETLEILAPAAPWQHVRPVGEDLVAREMIVPAFHELRPVDLGALLAGGIVRVPVLARPRVAIIPTGDELVPPRLPIGRGQIPEFNSAVLAGFLTQWGALPQVLPIVRDDPSQLADAISSALAAADMVIVNAGSSAGGEDFTRQAMESAGEVLVHGVATRPGKPTILGMADGKPLVGLPGYPVSAYLALEWFVRPLLFRCLGLAEPARPRVRAVLGRRIVSEMGCEEFIRLTVGFIDGRFVANPLNRGAGVTMSLVRADALLVVPARSLGHEQGDEVEIELYRPEEEVRRSLVAAGSHDLALDLLGAALRQEHPEMSLSSAHVGSMSGLAAIRSGQAHLAGIHLLDADTGAYNVPFVQRYLAGQHVVLVNLAHRMQGWIVPPGNPRGVAGVGDLRQPELRYVNRQRGAGTRMLLDHLLAREGVDPARIHGYQREEYTHLNVAAAVAAGTADVGLGILSAALAYGLGFVPVAEERYDLLMTAEFHRSDLCRALLAAIASPAFRQQVEELGGYSLRDAGRVMYEQ